MLTATVVSNCGSSLTLRHRNGRPISGPCAWLRMVGVAALRQTSVEIAALLGTIVLGERPWLWRVLAAGLVTASALLVATSGLALRSK